MGPSWPGLPFEVGFNPPPGARDVEAYQRAGLTWWVELAPDQGGPSAYRELIRRGPG